MKRLISALILVLVFGTAYGQLNRRVGRTPAISYDWKEGYVNITEINGGMGLSVINVPYSKNQFGITMVNGYQFSRNIKAGVGIGVWSQNDGFLVPIFVDGRFNLSGQGMVPFFGLAGGVAFSPEDLNNQSRIFFNPSVGVKYIVKRKTSVNLSMGLLTQGGGQEKRSSFINFKFGVEFKGSEWNF